MHVVRFFVGGLLQNLNKKKKMKKIIMISHKFKAWVDTQSFRFDSYPPIYVNRMQMSILTSPLQDTLESLNVICVFTPNISIKSLCKDKMQWLTLGMRIGEATRHGPMSRPI